MTTRRILALDLASRVGFAFGALGKKPEFGAYQLRKSGDDLGAYLTEFDDYLTRIARLRDWTGVDCLVVFECPVLPPQTSIATLRKLYALPAFLEFRFHSFGGDADNIREAHPGSIKKFWTGKGNAKKPDMIEGARVRGYDLGPAQDDEADALATWHFAAATVVSEISQR